MIRQGQWRKTKLIEAHEYIVKMQQPELFEAIKQYIREHGYWGTFEGKRYKYANVYGWRYWHFQFILNRANLKKSRAVTGQGVDDVATVVSGVGAAAVAAGPDRSEV